MKLNEYLNIMRDNWWVCVEEDKGRGGMTTDQLMTGFDMLDAIRNANDWNEVYNALEAFIDYDIEE